MSFDVDQLAVKACSEQSFKCRKMLAANISGLIQQLYEHQMATVD